MSTVLVFVLPFIAGAAATMAWKQRQLMNRWMGEFTERYAELAMDNTRLCGVVRALALRLNENGHVDLEAEEVEQNGEVKIFKDEGEIRVLVK